MIAVNDRSTDRTASIMDDFAAVRKRTASESFHVAELPRRLAKRTPCGPPASSNWRLDSFTDATSSSSRMLCGGDCLRRDGERRSHSSSATQDHETSRREHDDGIFQTLFMFRTIAPESCRSQERRSHRSGRVQSRRRSTTKPWAPTSLRMEVLDDMKLGKVSRRRLCAPRVFGTI